MTDQKTDEKRALRERFKAWYGTTSLNMRPIGSFLYIFASVLTLGVGVANWQVTEPMFGVSLASATTFTLFMSTKKTGDFLAGLFAIIAAGLLAWIPLGLPDSWKTWALGAVIVCIAGVLATGWLWPKEAPSAAASPSTDPTSPERPPTPRSPRKTTTAAQA